MTFENVIATRIDVLTGGGQDFIYLSGVTATGQTRIRSGSGWDRIELGYIPAFSVDGSVAPGDDESDAPSVQELRADESTAGIGTDIFDLVVATSSGDDRLRVDKSVFETVDIRLSTGTDTVGFSGNEFQKGGLVDAGEGGEEFQGDFIAGNDNAFNDDDDPNATEQDATEQELLIVDFEFNGIDTGVRDEADTD